MPEPASLNPPPAARPVRVVVFASEQLIPAISLLVHMWHQHGAALQAICIHHTDDEARSRLPALRLKRLLTDLGVDTLGCQLLLQCSDGAMPSVRAALHHWFCAAPDARWVVDATGGTKPMSAAAVEYTLAAEFLAERRAIYLELSGRWFEFGIDAISGLTTLQPPAAGDADIPPKDVLERNVPLELLTQTQHVDLVQVKTRQLPMVMDLVGLCTHAMHDHWRWHVPGIQGQGPAFECFIAGGLRAAGLHRLAWSAQVLLPSHMGGHGAPMAETDLVLCRGSTVCCIDLKLPGAQDPDARSTQLSRALHNARQLGGKAVKTLVLRPGWPPDANTQAIAAALGVVLLDQSHAAGVFSALLQHIAPGLPLPAELQAIETLLADFAQRSGQPVLSTTRTVFALVDDQVVDFDATTRVLMDHLARPWALVRLAPGAYLLQVAPGHATWAQPPDRAALRQAVLAVAGRHAGPAAIPRQHRVVRDDVAMLSVELVLTSHELKPLSQALDLACRSVPAAFVGP